MGVASETNQEITMPDPLCRKDGRYHQPKK